MSFHATEYFLSCDGEQILLLYFILYVEDFIDFEWLCHYIIIVINVITMIFASHQNA